MTNPIRLMALAAWACLLWQAQALADDQPRQQNAAQTSPQVKQPMDMDEPMHGGMMKKGMKTGDVKKSAEKHKEKMDRMLEQEQQSMPPMPDQTLKTQSSPQK